MDTLTKLMRAGIFNGLSVDDLSSWRPQIKLQLFKKDHTVFRERRRIDYLHVVASGRVKLDWIAADGRAHLMNFVEQGHSFGEHGLFDEWLTDSRGTATEDTQLVAVPRSVFLEMFYHFPAISQNVAKASLRNYRALNNIQMRSKNMSTESQLLRLLLQYGARFGEQDTLDNSSVHTTLSISNNVLASALCVSRQTVNGILNDWRKHQWVDLQYGKIFFLDWDALMNHYHTMNR